MDPGDPSPHETHTSFYAGLEFTTNSPGMDLIAYDVDGNGKLDILVPLLGGDIKILWNHSVPGRIEFDAGQYPEDTPLNLADVALGDLDEDGREDIFTLGNDGTVQIRLQDENGDFVLHSEYQAHGQCLLVDNVNSSDTTPDILLANSLHNEVESIDIIPWTLEADRDGRQMNILYSAEYLPTTSIFSDMILADFEGNGLLDVIVADEQDDSLQLYTHLWDPLGDQVYNPATGEVEVPQPGVYYSGQTTAYYQSYYKLPELGRTQSKLKANPKRLTSGDVNNDGLADIAVCCEYGGAMPPQPWYINTVPSVIQAPWSMIWILETSIDPWLSPNDTTWQTDNTVTRTAIASERIGLTFPGNINDVKLADIDQDGKLDLLGCCDGIGAGGFAFFYYPNLGNFQFGPPCAYSEPSPAFRLLANDFDGDGYPDVAVLLPMTNVISLHQNDANSGLGVDGTQYVFLED